MSKRRVLSFKSQPRLERRDQDGQHETEKPDHLARLGDSVTSSTRTRFSVHTGGWLPANVGNTWNWWQQSHSLESSDRSAIVDACVSAYRQTIAMCPGDHWRTNRRGGRTRVTTSALSRILRKPNLYQSISDFLLNATRSLYLEGNA